MYRPPPSPQPLAGPAVEPGVREVFRQVQTVARVAERYTWRDHCQTVADEIVSRYGGHYADEHPAMLALYDQAGREGLL